MIFETIEELINILNAVKSRGFVVNNVVAHLFDENKDLLFGRLSLGLVFGQL